jgi:hypothetical protein
MQHSTHHHTPTHHNHHHTHPTPHGATGCVRRPRPGAAREQHPPHRTTTDNNRRQRRGPGCPLRTQQRAKPPDPPQDKPTRQPSADQQVSRSTQPTHPDPHTGSNRASRNQKKGAPTPNHRAGEPPSTRWELLRKEVIQPHLPVRLPCYDFVPIASPTFDNSLPRTG